MLGTMLGTTVLGDSAGWEPGRPSLGQLRAAAPRAPRPPGRMQARAQCAGQRPWPAASRGLEAVAGFQPAHVVKPARMHEHTRVQRKCKPAFDGPAERTLRLAGQAGCDGRLSRARLSGPVHGPISCEDSARFGGDGNPLERGKRGPIGVVARCQ